MIQQQKKKQKKHYPSQEFQNIKGPKRERLIAERKSKGFTQGQLAEIVGCSTALISHLELGRVKPSIEVAMQLEKTFETPSFKLFPDL